MEAERHIRDGQLWWVAVWSAIASVISAAGAWMAMFIVVSNEGPSYRGRY
jgi:hypothetical protein